MCPTRMLTMQQLEQSGTGIGTRTGEPIRHPNMGAAERGKVPAGLPRKQRSSPFRDAKGRGWLRVSVHHRLKWTLSLVSTPRA